MSKKSAIADMLVARANDSNVDAKRLNENTAIENTSDVSVANTKTSSIIEEIRKENKKAAKKRINVSFDEEIYDKLITIANGKSVSLVMEKILSNAVEGVRIDKEVVKNFKDKMKKKGPKNKGTNKEEN